MKGKYHIVLNNNRVKFEFDVKRNITIIRGDSATGKTTLMNLIETYERLGDESGIFISCGRICKTLNNGNWESVIEHSHECIIFIDEDTKVIKTEEFAAKIKDSDNYYVIITRENLPNLPYSVDEVYGIKCSGKYMGTQQTYNSFYRIYGKDVLDESFMADLVLTEDSNSGYDFYNAVAGKGIECISAGGKTKIKTLVQTCKDKKILVIADAAAFGAEMHEMYLYVRNNPKVQMYLPEALINVIGAVKKKIGC